MTLYNTNTYLSAGLLTNLNTVRSVGYPGGTSTQCPYAPITGGGIGDCSQLTLVMQGFIFAATTGTYRLAVEAPASNPTVAYVDNYFGEWSGTTAYGSYTNSNSDFRARRQRTIVGTGTQTVTTPGSHIFTFQAGQYYPVTFIFINGGGPGGYLFTLQTPDGSVITDTSAYFIPACNTGNPFTNRDRLIDINLRRGTGPLLYI